ncbi:nucleoside monophosphate kinase [bacterium]|nr:nucleoside monophosphate kinase [bacterium]
MKKNIIIFFGPPGSGKGTQADILGEALNFPVISLGELLRHERDQGTKLGKQAAGLLAKGLLVSDEIVEDILSERLKKRDVSKGYILDGYPRREEQLSLFNKRSASYRQKPNITAIYIDVHDKEIKKRLSGRRVCDCGAAYHIKYNPPKRLGICDLCGAKLYQRKDDAPVIMRGRLSRFHKRISPILKYFEEHYKFFRVNGEQSIKEIQKEILVKLKKLKAI